MKKIPLFLIFSTGYEEGDLAGTSFSEAEAKRMLDELDKAELNFGQKGWALKVTVTGIPKAPPISLEAYHKLRGNLSLEQFVKRYEDFCKTNNADFRYCSNASVEEYIAGHPIIRSKEDERSLS